MSTQIATESDLDVAKRSKTLIGKIDRDFLLMRLAMLKPSCVDEALAAFAAS